MSKTARHAGTLDRHWEIELGDSVWLFPLPEDSTATVIALLGSEVFRTSNSTPPRLMTSLPPTTGLSGFAWGAAIASKGLRFTSSRHVRYVFARCWRVLATSPDARVSLPRAGSVKRFHRVARATSPTVRHPKVAASPLSNSLPSQQHNPTKAARVVPLDGRGCTSGT